MVATALPAGVMRQPLGRSKPPGMYLGSCFVGSPVLRCGAGWDDGLVGAVLAAAAKTSHQGMGERE